MNDALILWEGAGVGSRSGVQIGSGKLQKHSGKLLKNSVQNCSKNKIHWENQTFSIHVHVAIRKRAPVNNFLIILH